MEALFDKVSPVSREFEILIVPRRARGVGGGKRKRYESKRARVIAKPSLDRFPYK